MGKLFYNNGLIWSLSQDYEVDAIIAPILQMGKLRREATCPSTWSEIQT